MAIGKSVITSVTFDIATGAVTEKLSSPYDGEWAFCADAAPDAGGDTGDSTGDISGKAAEAAEEGRDPWGTPLIDDDEELYPGETEKKPKKAKKKSAPKEEGKGKVLTYKGGDDDEAQEDTTSTKTAPVDLSAMEDLFEKASKPAVETPEGEEEEEDLTEDGIEKGSRAEKRIRAQAKAFKELQGNYQEMEANAHAQYNARLQQQNQFQQQLAERDAKLAALEAKMEIFSQRAQDPQDLTDEQRLERQWLQKIQGAADQRIQEALKPFAEKLDILGRHAVQTQQQKKLDTIKQRFAYEAEQSLDEVLLADMDPEVLKDDRQAMKMWVYAVANDLSSRGGQSVSMRDAASMLRQVALKMGLAYVKAQTSKNKPIHKQARKAAPPLPQSHHASGTQSDPPNELLWANNWEDVVEWEMAGKPPLRPAPKE